MPNMSIQSLQIGLPCSRKFWEATNGIEWKKLPSEHDDSSTLPEKVKKFINSDHEMLQKPYDYSFSEYHYKLQHSCHITTVSQPWD